MANLFFPSLLTRDTLMPSYQSSPQGQASEWLAFKKSFSSKGPISLATFSRGMPDSQPCKEFISRRGGRCICLTHPMLNIPASASQPATQHKSNNHRSAFLGWGKIFLIFQHRTLLHSRVCSNTVHLL